MNRVEQAIFILKKWDGKYFKCPTDNCGKCICYEKYKQCPDFKDGLESAKHILREQKLKRICDEEKELS